LRSVYGGPYINAISRQFGQGAKPFLQSDFEVLSRSFLSHHSVRTVRHFASVSAVAFNKPIMDLFDPFERCSLSEDPDNVRELSEEDVRGVPIIDQSTVVDESSLTLESLPDYVKSLKWKDIHHALWQMQDLYLRFGYELSIRNSSDTVGRLECRHSGVHRSRISEDERKNNTTTGKQGCKFSINMSKPLSSKEAKLTKTQTFEHKEGCLPRPVLLLGGIILFRQLSAPLLTTIQDMVNSNKKLGIIRHEITVASEAPFIAPHVIQTAVNRVKALHGKRSQVAELIDALKDNPNKYVYRCSYTQVIREGETTSELTNIFFVTFQMISLMKQFGQFLVVDATYKSNEFGRPLLLFTIRVGTGAFTIAATSLIASESKANLHWSFEQLKEIIGDSWNDIAVVMTDGDPSYPWIIEKLLPHAKHQRCYWHQQRNMQTFCSIASDKVACWSLMEQAISSFNELDAQQHWNEMMERFFSRSVLQSNLEPATNNDNIDDDGEWRNRLPDKYRNALNLLDEWFSYRRTYWKSLTKGYLNFGSIASQGGESMNNALKRRSFVRLIDLLQMTEDLTRYQAVIQIDDSWKAQMKMPIAASIEEWHRLLRSKLTIWAVDQLTKQLDLAMTKPFLVVAVATAPYLLLVRSRRSVHTLNTTSMTCDCGFIASRGLLCRHFFATWKGKFEINQIEKLVNIALARTAQRWTHAAVEQAFEIKGLQATTVIARQEKVNDQRVHIAQTFNSLQFGIADQLRQIELFAKKNTLSARYATVKLHEFLPALLMADEATMKAATSSQSMQDDAVMNSDETSASNPSLQLDDPNKVGHHRVRSKSCKRRTGSSAVSDTS
jgi:MULE transposase domain